MNLRPFGNTGYHVPELGFGAGHIGKTSQDEASMGQLLNEALDLGINLIDTARAYGHSEERIGKYISHRRKEFILSSKGGYDSLGNTDWTYDTVLDNIDKSLERMKTEFIEIYHLHSCPPEILRRGDVILALEKAKEQGKIGIPAYSGENDALDCALESGRFGSIQCSVNICDQRSDGHQVRRAAESGMGIIVKRPLANAPWRYEHEPAGHHHAEYWHRFRKMHLNNYGMDWSELAMRFAAFVPGISTLITGTTSTEHLKENLRAIEKGPLPDDILEHIKDEFSRNDSGWYGLI